MNRLTTFTTLSVLFLSALTAPMPSGNSVDKQTTYYGKGTWFHPGLGACGYPTNTDSDSIVAVSPGVYGSGDHCDQWVAVTNTATGVTAYGQMRDKCPSCGNHDLDLSEGLFNQLGDKNQGVMQISWSFT